MSSQEHQEQVTVDDVPSQAIASQAIASQAIASQSTQDSDPFPWSQTQPDRDVSPELLVLSQLFREPPASNQEVGNRLDWSPRMEQALIEELVHQKRLGLMQENGWKSATWTPFAEVIKLHTPAHLRSLVTKQRMKSKLEVFKKLWKAWVVIIDLSGWSISDAGLPVASKEVMADFFKHHKGSRYFEKRPLPYQDELYELCQGRTATGCRAGGISRTLATAEGLADGEVEETNLTGDPAQDTTHDLVEDVRITRDVVKERVAVAVTGSKRQKLNQREMRGLTGELKRSNDLLQQRLADANLIRAAVACWIKLTETEEEFVETELDQHIKVLDAIATGDSAAWVFLEVTTAMRRKLVAVWLARE